MKKNLIEISLFIILILALCLGGCGIDNRNSTQPDTMKENLLPSLKTVSGYISTELSTPDWIGSFGKSEAVGDVFYIVTYTVDNNLAIAAYDTVHDNWQRIDLNTGNSIYPGVSLFSASKESLWVILKENYTRDEINAKDYSRSLAYYLILSFRKNQSSHKSKCL